MKAIWSRRLCTLADVGKARSHRARPLKGQNIVELALVLPFLLLLFAVMVEGSLAVNAWIRVNTAARDATRFAMDAGRPADTASLVLRKLNGLDATQINVYVVTGSTDITGTITTWTVQHPYGAGGTNPSIQQSTVQTRLRSQGTGPSQSVPFTIVEVDYIYAPLVLGAVLRTLQIPMISYAVVQQY